MLIFRGVKPEHPLGKRSIPLPPIKKALVSPRKMDGCVWGGLCHGANSVPTKKKSRTETVDFSAKSAKKKTYASTHIIHVWYVYLHEWLIW